MGAWGPKLYQDDIAEDVKTEYKELLQRGKTSEEARQSIIKSYSEYMVDEDDREVFWMSFADVLWNLGRLTEEIKQEAIKAIEGGKNLERWKEEGTPKEYKIRQEVLEKLKEKLNSPMPEEKKISKFRIYKCEWKVGDTFAYKLEGETVKGTKFEGEYFIIRKIGEGTWWPGHIIPVVYVQITKDKKLPSTKEEIERLEYIKLFIHSAGKFKYRTKLINSSKRIIPKKLIYLGNFQEIQTPKDEGIVEDELYIWACAWKSIERLLIGHYKNLNEKQREIEKK